MAQNVGGRGRATKAAAAATLAVLALAGCGSDGDVGGTSATTAAPEQASGAAPEEAVRAVARQYIRSYASGDGEATCEVASSALREGLAQAPGADSCAEGVVAARGSHDLNERELAAVTDMVGASRITSVAIDGDVATADFVSDFGGVPLEQVLRLIREDGRWVVEQLEQDPDPDARAALGAAMAEAEAAFDCPVDAAAVSELVGVQVRRLPENGTPGCRFGRPGPEVRGEDARYPFVLVMPAEVRDLELLRKISESNLEPGDELVDQPQWGRGAFKLEHASDDTVSVNGYVPADGFVSALGVSLPRGRGAGRDRHRIADALVVAVRGR